MKILKTFSNFYFLPNFTKFVFLNETNIFFFNTIYFLHKMITKFLLMGTVTNYCYYYITSERYVVPVLLFLRNHYQLQFKVLIDICVSDFYTKLFRFQVNYLLLSMFFTSRLILKLNLLSFQNITTITTIYKNANWMEREVWDLFGIWVAQHTDLRRILTDYTFFGSALRKDFPLTGYIELYYDEFYNSLLFVKISLQQHFRLYTVKTIKWLVE
jgi:NADH:ubiquinone oxidoreductase subunit C